MPSLFQCAHATPEPAPRHPRLHLFTSLTAQAFQSELAEFQNFGTLFGDAIKTADTFALVAVPERMRMETQK